MVAILSRQTIEKYCRLDKMVERRDGEPLKIEPVSIDIHLADCEYTSLRPGDFCLGNTIETFNMPGQVVGFVVGKSTYAREGLMIEVAGLIDPGFRGDITLELKNLHDENTIHLEKGQSIGQVYFMYTDRPVDILYGPDNGNHYQDQQGITYSYRGLG